MQSLEHFTFHTPFLRKLLEDVALPKLEGCVKEGVQETQGCKDQGDGDGESPENSSEADRGVNYSDGAWEGRSQGKWTGCVDGKVMP